MVKPPPPMAASPVRSGPGRLWLPGGRAAAARVLGLAEALGVGCCGWERSARWQGLGGAALRIPLFWGRGERAGEPRRQRSFGEGGGGRRGWRERAGREEQIRQDHSCFVLTGSESRTSWPEGGMRLQSRSVCTRCSTPSREEGGRGERLARCLPLLAWEGSCVKPGGQRRSRSLVSQPQGPCRPPLCLAPWQPGTLPSPLGGAGWLAREDVLVLRLRAVAGHHAAGRARAVARLGFMKECLS